MRLNTCRVFVSVDDVGGERDIRPPQLALLLRLLLLWRDEYVPHDVVSRVLNIQPTGVRKYCANLNDHLAKGAVESVQGHLNLTWGREDTDFAEFRRLVENAKFVAGDLSDLRAFSPQLVEAENLLEHASKLWQASPATGLDSFKERPRRARGRANSRFPKPEDQISLEDIAFEWEDHRTEQLIFLADLLLIDGQGPTKAKEAFVSLTDLVKHPESGDRIWRRRLSAADKMEDLDRHRSAWKQCLAAYERSQRKMPDDLRRLAPKPPTQLIDVQLPTTVSEAAELVRGLGEEIDPRLALIDTLGIAPASSTQLRGSRLEPSDCIERAKHTLWFAGVLAGKWVNPPAVRNSLEKLLQSFDSEERPPGSEVRFLVLDPQEEGYARLQQMRGDAVSPESLNVLIELAGRYQCLEVRGIAALPAFRVIVIDDDLVSFSPYSLEQEARVPNLTGWDSPHVTLDPLAPWPLASAFRLYFQQTWDDARPLEVAE